MDVLITIPEEFDEEYQTELYTLLKNLCENIGTDGLPCRKINVD